MQARSHAMSRFLLVGKTICQNNQGLFAQSQMISSIDASTVYQTWDSGVAPINWSRLNSVIFYINRASKALRLLLRYLSHFSVQFEARFITESSAFLQSIGWSGFQHIHPHTPGENVDEALIRLSDLRHPTARDSYLRFW